MLKYLKAKFPTTRAGFLAGVACGASAASFLFASLSVSAKILFIVGWAYLFAAWALSRIDHTQKLKDIFEVS